MRRRRKVTAPDRLSWTVKRLLFPNAVRPMSRTEILDAATPRRTHVDGISGSVPDAFYGVTGPLPLGALVAVAMLPLVPLVLGLRYARLLRWTVEARAYPWGRRYPPIVLTYLVRGHREAAAAVDEVADALGRGDGSPRPANAEFVPQNRGTHDGSGGGRATFSRAEGSLYRPGRR
jgi:hypothetical protein